jgi:hypothetical protein
VRLDVADSENIRKDFFQNLTASPALIIKHAGTNTNTYRQYEEGLTFSGIRNIVQLRLSSAQGKSKFLWSECVPEAEFTSRLSAKRGKSVL